MRRQEEVGEFGTSAVVTRVQRSVCDNLAVNVQMPHARVKLVRGESDVALGFAEP